MKNKTNPINLTYIGARVNIVTKHNALRGELEAA